MFNFISKTKSLFKRCSSSITTTNHYKQFAFPIATTSKEHSFTVTYLINSCGLSPKFALSASKQIQLKSSKRPDSVIALFKSHGFSQTQISKIIRCHPRVLCLSPEKTLLPKLEFYYSKGISSSELAREPDILHRSLENYIIPNFNCLCDFFKSSETAVAIVKSNPPILGLEVETYVATSVNVLRDIGVPEPHVLLFLRMWASPRKTNFAIFRKTVEVVKEMGISPLKSQFILAVHAKLYGENNWESRVDIYRRWGWSEEEFLAAFRQNPLCMIASKDKIMAVMDFLVNEMDIESSAIAKHPYLIGFSIEKRFIPRAAVFQFLLSKGLIKRKKNTNLFRLFKLPEKAFLQNFVNSYDEAPELLKLYQEKLALSKMTKGSVSQGMDDVIVK